MCLWKKTSTQLSWGRVAEDLNDDNLIQAMAWRCLGNKLFTSTNSDPAINNGTWRRPTTLG